MVSKIKEIKESYQPLNDKDDRFDIEFWQAQGDRAIFDAAIGMIKDYLLIRDGHVDEPRLQRSVEYYGKI